MAQEIERKFLVLNDDFKKGIKPIFIQQGFINTAKETVIRVRMQGDRGFITIKSHSSGITRSEYEYEIPPDDAREMISTLCLKAIIEKYRYISEFEGHTWEVDQFLGENKGLVVAEIELSSEDEIFTKPPWLGEEVTGAPRYYNVNLIAHPFCEW